MTRALFALLAVAGMIGLTGCASTQKKCGSLGCSAGCASGCATSTCGCGCGCDSCNIFSGGCGVQCCSTQRGGCGHPGCGMRGGGFLGGGSLTPRGWDGQRALVSGPATGSVTYPYYTVRGPRDFLTLDNRPIGP